MLCSPPSALPRSAGPRPSRRCRPPASSRGARPRRPGASCTPSASRPSCRTRPRRSWARAADIPTGPRAPARAVPPPTGKRRLSAQVGASPPDSRPHPHQQHGPGEARAAWLCAVGAGGLGPRLGLPQRPDLKNHRGMGENPEWALLPARSPRQPLGTVHVPVNVTPQTWCGPKDSEVRSGAGAGATQPAASGAGVAAWLGTGAGQPAAGASGVEHTLLSPVRGHSPCLSPAGHLSRVWGVLARGGTEAPREEEVV